MGNRQRQHAEDEGERGHQDRAEPLARRFGRRLADRHPAVAERRRELDDQDGVLGGQPDHRHESDLEVDVTGHPAQPDAEEGAEDAEGDAENDGERNRPALVLCRQHQEDQHQAQNEDHAAVALGGPLLERLATVRATDPLCRVLVGDQLVDAVEHLARAAPGRRHRGDQCGGEAVEATQDAWPALERGADERRERHHVAVVGAHLQAADVLRPLPERRLCLGLHAVGAAVEVEVIDIERRQGRLHRLEDVGQRDAARLRRLAVDRHPQLRHVGAERTLHAAEDRQLVGVADELLDRRGKLRERLPRPRLQVQLESRGGAKARDFREVEGECQRLANGPELTVGAADDGVDAQVGRLSLFPRLQVDEDDRRVGLRREGQCVEPDQRGSMPHPRVLEQERLDLGHHFLGPLLRGTVGQLHADREEALVFGRDERLGDMLIQHADQDDQDREDRQRGPRPGNDAAHGTGVPRRRLREGAIEPGEESRAVIVVAADRFLEQHGTECRRERQRDDAREHHRQDDRHGELLVHLAGDAAEEGHGDEDGAEHQDDRHQGAADLTHRLVGRHPGRDLLLGHDPFDVLDDDDRVVDDDADRQHQAEEREHVDREAQHQQADEGADHGDWHRQHRDQRRAPALQEEEDHQRHQEHRLGEGLHDLDDRLLDERRGVIGHRPLHARRKRLLQLVHPRLEELADIERVGAVAQVDEDERRRLAVESGDLVIVARGERHRGDVLDADQGAVVVGPEDHVAEFLRRREPALRRHGDGELGAGRRRLAAEAAGRVGGALLAHRARDIADGEAELCQTIRIDRNRHRELELSEDAGTADARDPLDLVLDVELGVVGQIRRIELAILRIERGREEQIALCLRDHDAVAADLFGQLRLGQLDGVLHVDGGQVLLPRDVEVHCQVHHAVGRVGRLVVEQPVEARELLLDRRCDGQGHVLGGRAGVDGRHAHRRRRDLRIAVDRQPLQGEEPEQRDHDRDDGRHDGPPHEVVLQLGFGPVARGGGVTHLGAPAGAFVVSAAPMMVGFTTAPGPVFWSPSTITRSPAFSPFVITQRAPAQGPTSTSRTWTVSPAPTT